MTALEDHEHYTRLQKSFGAMEPNTKLILDEIAKLRADIESQDTKYEARVSAFEAAAPTGMSRSFHVKEEVDAAVVTHFTVFESRKELGLLADSWVRS